MKAVVYDQYGPPEVLRLAEVERPWPKNGEVLVRVVAASLNRSDWEGLTGTPLYARLGGLRKPRHPILGSDISGRVEEAGRDVRRFKPGDEVFADILWQGGGLAECACAPERTWP